MDAEGYFVAGLLRPLVLLILWVPLMAFVLYIVRRYFPRHERWLFYRITWTTIGRAIRRGLTRRGRAAYLPAARRRISRD